MNVISMIGIEGASGVGDEGPRGGVAERGRFVGAKCGQVSVGSTCWASLF